MSGEARAKAQAAALEKLRAAGNAMAAWRLREGGRKPFLVLSGEQAEALLDHVEALERARLLRNDDHDAMDGDPGETG